MQIVFSDEELTKYVKEAVALSSEHPILIDQYINGKEVEVDAISDRDDILIQELWSILKEQGFIRRQLLCLSNPVNISGGAG